MGDRANIVINSRGGEKPRVFFYTHWSGYELPNTLQKALNRGQGRWNDEQYLSRIIFNEMTAGNEMETTGFGITSYLCDNEYNLLVVDSDKQQVWLENEEQTKATDPISFAEYVSLDLTEGWDALKQRLGSLRDKPAAVEQVDQAA